MGGLLALTRRLPLLPATAALLLVACAADAGSDARFAEKLAVGGNFEVQAGQLAATRATNSEIKRFAEMMISDHGKANDDLKQLAATEGVTLPKGLDEEHRSLLQHLSQGQGREFEQQYLQAMLSSHRETLQLLDTERQQGSSTQFRAFAERLVPTVRHHLEMAKALEAGKR